MTPGSSWIQGKGNGVIVRCQIQPRASCTEIVGMHGEPPRLKIRVAAPAVDGEANSELIVFLSKKLKIAKSRIHILTGQSGKLKEIFISEINVSEASRSLMSF